MISTSSIKNLQKTKKCYFQTSTILVLELKEASKQFSKKVPMTKFWFKQCFMFCLNTPKKGFNFVTQNLPKTVNLLSKCSEHSFLISRSLQNHFLKTFLWAILNLNGLEDSFSLFQKRVSTSSLKTKKIKKFKKKNALFKRSEHSF